MLKKPEHCLYCRAEISIPGDAASVRCAYCGHVMEIASFTRTEKALQSLIDEARAAMSEGVAELQRQHAESQALKMQMLFERGEALQRSGKFDEAARCYGEITLINSCEAEVYWRLFLCHHGVEYVPDPRTGEFVPTLSHLCTDSIPDDADYQAALKYARSENVRAFYKQQAAAIALTLRKYMQLRDSEKAYDVFICVRQSDDHDKPTRDSQIAQDLYYALTNDHGLRVFNSLIVMPQHAGEEYEPFIMAALMSARVMVVVSTSPENITSPWVRNEWRRYSWLMDNADRPRKLIAYLSGMTAKELPAELGALQAIDGTRLDAATTLVQSILTHLDRKGGNPPHSTPKKKKTGAQLVATPDSLLRRAAIFLGDCNYTKASYYYDRVLDINPECARAYIGQLCIELKLLSEDSLVCTPQQLLPIRGDTVLCPACGAELSENRHDSCIQCGQKLRWDQQLLRHALQYADADYRRRILDYIRSANLRIRFIELQDEYRTLKCALDECTALDGAILPSLFQNPSTADQMADRCAGLHRAIDLLGEVRTYDDVEDVLQRASVLMPAVDAKLAEMRAYESTFAGKCFLLGRALKRNGCRLGKWMLRSLKSFGKWLLDLFLGFLPYILAGVLLLAVLALICTLIGIWLIKTEAGNVLLGMIALSGLSSLKKKKK